MVWPYLQRKIRSRVLTSGQYCVLYFSTPVLCVSPVWYCISVYCCMCVVYSTMHDGKC